ncbi:MAG: hypothetical protein SFT93_06155, partial [Rickettsiaceae bacterium]|nr:hypothetical protein [Rickettsiaceae bacterium]
SSLASIIPGTLIVDKVLTRVNDFVKTKELKTSARKITHLAATDIEIYNFAGKLVNRIVSNSDYQQKILSLTETSFEEEDRRFIDKIRKLFETIGQTFDEVLYGAKYKSLHEKLGAIDAGKLIETYLADENIVIHTEEDKEKLANRFYEEIISHTHNSSYITQQTLHSRSIFILQGIIYDDPLLNFLSKKENREMLKELTKYPLTSRGVSKLTDIFDYKDSTEDQVRSSITETAPNTLLGLIEQESSELYQG